MPDSLEMRTRIAPTPSGFLHTGNACSFLLTEHLARQQGGSVLLRIDDLDSERVRHEYLADIFDTLAFLNISYQLGPSDVYDFAVHYTQQIRLPLYEAMLARLLATGLVYACACSRKQWQENNNQCRCKSKNLPLHGTGNLWRIHVPENTVINFSDKRKGQVALDLSAAMADFVIRKRDGMPSYQVASLADDLYYGINYIVRGEDLLASTAAQLYLAVLAGKENFVNVSFYHHPLLRTGDGLKLSKSAGAVSIREMRRAGVTVQDIEKVLKNWL